MQTTTEYLDCIEYLRSMFNASNCDAFICYSEFNNSFEKVNAQSRHLSNLIPRNDILLSWDHSGKKVNYFRLFMIIINKIGYILLTESI